MQRLPFFLLLSLTLVSAGNAAYLPVVDVSHGTVSARAAFGEEVMPVSAASAVNVASVPEKIQKKVVARSAKKSVANHNDIVASADVLRPHKPSSDLWAQSDAPLRMPRMDEIALINYDAVLPEESLDVKPVVKTAVAQPVPKVQRVAQRQPVKTVADNRITRDEAMSELKQLREEVSRLAKLQLQTQETIAAARPMAVQTPISGTVDVRPAVKKDVENRSVNTKREVVDAPHEIASRQAVASVAEPKLTSVKEMSKMSPNELKKAFKKTYLSENKHLSTYQTDDKFDVVSDMSSSSEGFTAKRDLSEMDGGVRPMEIKISFLNGDAGLSRDNYTLLSETAAIVVNNPKRAIQIAIPESATHTKDARKLAARRLAIVEQALRDTGVADQRIVPVLSQRSDDVFVLRVISGEVFESLTQQKRNMFGDDVSKKTYKSMTW